MVNIWQLLSFLQIESTLQSQVSCEGSSTQGLQEGQFQRIYQSSNVGELTLTRLCVTSPMDCIISSITDEAASYCLWSTVIPITINEIPLRAFTGTRSSKIHISKTAKYKWYIDASQQNVTASTNWPSSTQGHLHPHNSKTSLTNVLNFLSCLTYVHVIPEHDFLKPHGSVENSFWFKSPFPLHGRLGGKTELQ